MNTTEMTLRDYFIAHAPITMQHALQYHGYYGTKRPDEYTPAIETLCHLRIAYADTMMKLL